MTPEEVKTDKETVDEAAAGDAPVDEVPTEEAADDETAVDKAGTDEVIADKVIEVEITTEEDRLLREYELVLVISPEVTEERFEAVIDKVSQFVTGNGGAIINIDRWGKKNLAYPIKHHVDASYVLSRFKMKPAFGKELETSLRISTEVLRHLLIKLD
ncbi:MAG: 30S ribosomal protein S6 [Dehalococcoidales bacterium]